jgi:hypothetical protein
MGPIEPMGRWPLAVSVIRMEGMQAWVRWFIASGIWEPVVDGLAADGYSVDVPDLTDAIAAFPGGPVLVGSACADSRGAALRMALQTRSYQPYPLARGSFAVPPSWEATSQQPIDNQ